MRRRKRRIVAEDPQLRKREVKELKGNEGRRQTQRKSFE